MRNPEHDSGDPDLGRFRETFGLAEEEYELLLASDDSPDRCHYLSAELSVILVGHLSKEEIGEFLRIPRKVGTPPDSPYRRETTLLELAGEPNGLQRVVNEARREVSRRVAARGTASAPVPEAKKR